MHYRPFPIKSKYFSITIVYESEKMQKIREISDAPHCEVRSNPTFLSFRAKRENLLRHLPGHPELVSGSHNKKMLQWIQHDRKFDFFFVVSDGKKNTPGVVDYLINSRIFSISLSVIFSLSVFEYIERRSRVSSSRMSPIIRNPPLCPVGIELFLSRNL